MDPVKALQTQVDAKRREVDDARAAVARLEFELTIWKQAAELAAAAAREGDKANRPTADFAAVWQKPSGLPPPPGFLSTVRLPSHEADDVVRSERKRGLNLAWRTVFAAMAERYPAALGLEAIGQIAAERGFQIKPDTVRGMLSSYVREGFAERLGPGQFRVTAQGAAAAGATLPRIGPDAPASPEAGIGLAGITADDATAPEPSGTDFNKAEEEEEVNL